MPSPPPPADRRTRPATRSLARYRRHPTGSCRPPACLDTAPARPFRGPACSDPRGARVTAMTLRRLWSCGVLLSLSVSAQSQTPEAAAPLRIGLIGLDTSHVVEFTRI